MATPIFNIDEALAFQHCFCYCFAFHSQDDTVLKNRLQTIRQTLVQAAKETGRAPSDILILAASKAQSVESLREAYQAGLRDFGENYLQEALEKQQALADLPLHWHFIGPIQSRKCTAISLHFDWVHTVDREKLARLLSEHRPDALPPLQVCIQVNLDAEPQKAGLNPKDCAELAAYIQSLPKLTLRGLMAIPMPQQEEQAKYQSLLRLRDLRDTLNRQSGLQMDTLSMGMSDDLHAAVRAGSTIVRPGRALFGERI